MSTPKKVKQLAVLNLIGFLVMVAVNVLSVVLPLAGRSQVEISDSYYNMFVPAGFTFSIWSVIYLALIVFIFHSFSKQKVRAFAQIVQDIGSLFFISCLINVAWIFAWHYLQIELAMLLMIGLLVSILMIYLRIEKSDIRNGSFEDLTMRLPFRMYAGWISVATIANVAALLTDYQWNGFGIEPQIWVMIMTSIAALIGLFMLFRYRDFVFSLVILWALWGILNERLNDVEANDILVERGIHVLFAVLVLGMVIRFFRKEK